MRSSLADGVQVGADLIWKGLLLADGSQAAVLEVMVDCCLGFVVGLGGLWYQSLDDMARVLKLLWMLLLLGGKEGMRGIGGRERRFVGQVSREKDQEDGFRI